MTAGETALLETTMSALLNNTDFVAFDTETGGLNSAECALLSIAAVPSWDAPPLSIHILPVGRIDPKAAEVNGYSAEEWARRGAVTPKVALLEFLRWLDLTSVERAKELGVPRLRFDMAAHNAGFDLLFILAAQARTGVELLLPGVWHCTKIKMEEGRREGLIVEPEIAHPENEKPGNHLNDLGRLSGFWELEPRSQAHDALQDARCCVHGLKWLRGLAAAKEKGGR